MENFSEPRPLVAAAFRLPHDGDLKVASTSTRLKAYHQMKNILKVIRQVFSPIHKCNCEERDPSLLLGIGYAIS